VIWRLIADWLAASAVLATVWAVLGNRAKSRR
jgi:hypothetical protein